MEPKDYGEHEVNDTEDSQIKTEAESGGVVAMCSACKQMLPSVAHRNCANLDCNKLFL